MGINARTESEAIQDSATANAQIATGDCHTYAPATRCIYCGATDGLTKEHIIPYAINGNWTIPNGSCRPCADIIGKYETLCLQIMLKPLRTSIGMQSRKGVEEHIAVTAVGPEAF